MKNTLKINHAERIIVMDRTFAKFASDTRSDEYAHLQKVRVDYPNYQVVQRHIRRNVEKKTYAGLTYDYMRKYIKKHGAKEKCEANLAELEEKILIASCHGKAFRYPVIKGWFLEQYPEIAKFGLKDDEESEDGTSKSDEIAPLKKSA